MNKYKWEQKKNKEALAFFKKFVGWLAGGKIQIIHWGFWHIGSGKFGLSMYWESEE